MQILLFFIFVAAVVFFLVGLGFGLSSLEERSSIPRWRMPQEMQHRRKARGHRVRSRFEG